MVTVLLSLSSLHGTGTHARARTRWLPPIGRMTAMGCWLLGTGSVRAADGFAAADGEDMMDDVLGIERMAEKKRHESENGGHESDRVGSATSS